MEDSASAMGGIDRSSGMHGASARKEENSKQGQPKLLARLRDWRPVDIAGHAIISDCLSGALVYRDGTMDWFAIPHFDSEAAFAALLGSGENGAWWMSPSAAITRCERRYQGDSLILETVFETAQGSVAVIDFMPAGRGEAPDIVRIVEGRSGKVDMESHLALRFSDGRIHPLVLRRPDKRVIAIAGPDGVIIRGEAPTDDNEGFYSSCFSVREGESVAFVLTWFPSHRDEPKLVDARKALVETRKFWKRWVDQCSLDGEHRARIIRSLLTLKALTDANTGGMVAALTASLPESPQGKRNWDYRYCWLRDASLTLRALLDLGYTIEAEAFLSWVLHATRLTWPELQIL
jgi:GH15 family glucan-1,4-alpha-glucosidase